MGRSRCLKPRSLDRGNRASGRFLNSCLAAVLLLCGCSTKPPEKAGLGASTAGSDSWLTVTEDQTLIRQARSAAEQAESDRIAKIFETLGISSFIDSEIMDLLELDRPGSIEKLSARIPKEGVTDESVGAALLLCRMHQEMGRIHAIRVLTTGTKEQRQRVLDDITMGVYEESEISKFRDFLFNDNACGAALLSQLNDPDQRIVADAIQCCGYLRAPGANVRFLEMLKRPQTPDKRRILYWLSQGELTEELFNLADETWRAASAEDRREASVFEAFAIRAGEPLKAKAKGRLREILRDWPDDATFSYKGDRLGILTALSTSAGPEDLTWLRELATKESGHYAVDPLVAVLRLSPSEGRKLLLQWLDNHDRRNVAINAAGKAFESSADEEIVRKLAMLAESVDDRELNVLCGALGSIGGEAASRTIEKHAARLDPAVLAHSRQLLAPVSLDSLGQALRDAGLLSSEETELAVRELSQQADLTSPNLFAFLAAAKSALAFDAETGMVPCRHDLLILDLAEASRGRFRPEAVLEILDQENEDESESPYTLQFVANNRLYQAEIRNLGDWYDVERVVHLVNAVLSQQGAAERFLPLAVDGQLVELVFADPQLIAGIAAKFHMALGDDYEAAMKSGLQAEEYFREQLQKTGR